MMPSTIIAGEYLEAVVQVRQLLGIEPVVTGEQHAAFHDPIRFRVAFWCDAFGRIAEAGLADYVAGEYNARLDVALLQENLEISAREWRGLS